MYDNDEIFEMWLEEEDLTHEMLQEMEIIDLQLNMYTGENGVTTEFVYETVNGEIGVFHGFDIDYDMEEEENLTTVGLNCKVYDAMYLTLFDELPEKSYIGEYVEFVFKHTI